MAAQRRYEPCREVIEIYPDWKLCERPAEIKDGQTPGESHAMSQPKKKQPKPDKCQHDLLYVPYTSTGYAEYSPTQTQNGINGIQLFETNEQAYQPHFSEATCARCYATWNELPVYFRKKLGVKL